jgi:hypothetical protein
LDYQADTADTALQYRGPSDLLDISPGQMRLKVEVELEGVLLKLGKETKRPGARHINVLKVRSEVARMVGFAKVQNTEALK